MAVTTRARIHTTRATRLEITDDYLHYRVIEQKDLEKAAELYQQALDAGYEPDEEDQVRLEEVLGEDAAPQTEMETEQESTLVRRAGDK